jgi:hypothetical protein
VAKKHFHLSYSDILQVKLCEKVLDLDDRNFVQFPKLEKSRIRLFTAAAVFIDVNNSLTVT